MELLITAITAFTGFILSSFAYLKNRKSATNVYFALLLLAISLYPVFNYLSLHSDTDASSFLWAKFILYTAIPAGPLFYLFVTSFPNPQFIIHRRIFYLVSLWVVLNLIFTNLNLIFSSVRIENGAPQIQPGNAVASFGILQVLTILVGAGILITKYRKSRGLLRLQLRYITFGILSSFGLTLFSTLLLPLVFNVTILLPISPIFLLIAGISISYSILRHRLMDIRLVVARSIAYLMLVTLLGIFYSGATFIVSSFVLKESLRANQLVISTFITLIIAFTFQPLRRYLEIITDKIFFKGAYDSDDLLNRLTRIMATNISLKEIAQRLLKEMLGQMRISRGVFILTEADNIFDMEAVGFQDTAKFSQIDIMSLIDEQKMLVFEELEEGQIKDIMRKMDITVAAPLKSGNEEIGILFLGEKLSGDIYSDQDLKLLEIFIPEASIAIQNAQAYEEIRRFNITLKEEINKATAELKNANFKLQELDKLKDEFVSVASHDLRTPMTAIKYYLWLILKGKKIDEAKTKFYLERSYTSSERMLTLINDLLNVSRIESGRIKLNLAPMKLEDTIQELMDEMQSKATEKGISLNFLHPTGPLPMAMADAERFPEILQNLVGNALKFTMASGRVSVDVKEKDNMIEISVADTGVGIRQEDMPKLFTKFGRLDSSYVAAATNGGTGLGLYITKNLIELHGGKIWVTSEVGKGTTFIFTLKIATPDDLVKKPETLPMEGAYFAPPS